MLNAYHTSNTENTDLWNVNHNTKAVFEGVYRIQP